MLNIVLLEPEIPFNTGAIGRTCVASGVSLHLIRPYGFLLSDKYLKRSGMDYWHLLDLHEYNSYEDFLKQNPSLGLGTSRLFFATTKGQHVYSDVTYGVDDYIMFGRESAGIPEELLIQHPDECIRIPMGHDIRSLNLSNSVSVILYEALRQNRFPGLEDAGSLHRLTW